MNLPSDYVTIRILFFARAREFTGKNETFLQVPRFIKGGDLLHFITDKYNLKQLRCNIILALNESWIDQNTALTLEDTDEVAVIPPLSGVPANTFNKMNFVKLTGEKLCIETLYDMVLSPEFGAISLFVGTTRNNFEGKVVSKLEYEAYEGMAVKSLENICEKIRKKFDVGNIAIYHRLGDVPVQEASVVIAISSAHRKPALSAVSFAIDALKADVPIWKKEVYEDGKSSEWKENSESRNETSLVNSEFVQLYEEVVEADNGNEVPLHLVQINANLQEINRRINSFINRKREQINESNIQDFCLEKSVNSDEGTCARVSAVLMRRKDSKSHLKVHRVENSVGPQTHGFEPGSFYTTARDGVASLLNCPPGAEERLTNAENYLNVNRSSRDVFSRLKAIEDKILYLESISPEYFDFDREEKPKGKLTTFIGKKTYTSLELDLKMQKLEEKLQKKSNI